MFRVTVLTLALLSAGCVSLDPTYQRPDAPVPATLPGAHGEANAVVSQWQQVMNDARLKSVVTMALNSNRDVQKAIADIDAARAQYGETRSSLFPTVDAELSHTRSRTLASGVATSDEANGAVSSFELDLFGRNQSLSRAARETWLASEFTAQNTRPAGVSSSALLRRPDIQEAEHNLLSANANIGAARANFFPTISLTASAGVGSDSLSSLFSHGMKVWSFAPSITLPLFSGGNNMAQLRYAEAEKKGLIATYEKTIQSAFKDVADALARRETLSEQLDAQREYVAAEQKTLDVATRSYKAGAGDYLTVLTAQRSLWSAQESLIALQQTDLENRITLWQSLGGGIQ